MSSLIYRYILAMLFWSSIPACVILGSWVPMGVGLLILVLGTFIPVIFRALHDRQVDKSAPKIVNGVWSGK